MYVCEGITVFVKRKSGPDKSRGLLVEIFPHLFVWGGFDMYRYIYVAVGGGGSEVGEVRRRVRVCGCLLLACYGSARSAILVWVETCII